MSYQWRLNGTNIPGANSIHFTITNVTQSNLGDYSVVLTNASSSVTSSNALLLMYPFITTPFSGLVASWGKDVSLHVGAWGTGPLNYQWIKDGNALVNATNETLFLPTIQSTNAGLYSVIVSNTLGSVTNAPAQVVVNIAGISLGFSPTLTIEGVIGYSYLIQRTANLSNTNSWATMTNLTLAQPVQIWVDTSADASSPFNSKYFYQILPGQ
jgi:hypothetical protein